MANWYLIRGLMREAGHWGDFLKDLEEKFPNDKIFCLEIPGNGKYFQEKSPCSISKMVGFARREFQQLQKENPSEKNYLLSISMGSMVGLAWLSHYPQDFHGAILINTSFRGLSPFYERLRPQCYGKVLKMLFTSSVAEREETLVKIISNRPDKWAVTAKKWIEIQEKRPVNNANALRQLLAAACFHAPYAIKLPRVLLLNSLADRMVSSRCSENAKKRWGVDLRTHSSAGHDLPHDDGAWVAQEIKNWISTHA